MLRINFVFSQIKKGVISNILHLRCWWMCNLLSGEKNLTLWFSTVLPYIVHDFMFDFLRKHLSFSRPALALLSIHCWLLNMPVWHRSVGVEQTTTSKHNVLTIEHWCSLCHAFAMNLSVVKWTKSCVLRQFMVIFVCLPW